MRNQRPYVLDRLRRAGSRGVHSWDLRREGIGNPSQRIAELEEDGHGIKHDPAPRDGCPGKQYTLIRDAELDVERHDNRPTWEARGERRSLTGGVVSLGALSRPASGDALLSSPEATPFRVACGGGMTRAEKVARAQKLREEGLTLREIGERMGAAISTVDTWISDPDLSRARARKSSYERQACVDCGAATCYGSANGKRDEPLCLACSNDHRTIWTREALICAIEDWAAIHGEPPAQSDWNPWNARNRLHDEERARRFESERGRWPMFTSVVRAFGSWSAALAAAGFEPRPAHGGGANVARRRSQRRKSAA